MQYELILLNVVNHGLASLQLALRVVITKLELHQQSFLELNFVFLRLLVQLEVDL